MPPTEQKVVEIIWHDTPPTPAQLAAHAWLWSRLLGTEWGSHGSMRKPGDIAETGSAEAPVGKTEASMNFERGFFRRQAVSRPPQQRRGITDVSTV